VLGLRVFQENIEKLKVHGIKVCEETDNANEYKIYKNTKMFPMIGSIIVPGSEVRRIRRKKTILIPEKSVRKILDILTANKLSNNEAKQKLL